MILDPAHRPVARLEPTVRVCRWNYGTSDATSWFLVLLDATRDHPVQEELSAHTRAAAGWLENALGRGGGFVRCGPRRFAGGLAQ